jgi:pSer/pThr/pTyr-binding forkhead associated (FHA) protein
MAAPPPPRRGAQGGAPSKLVVVQGERTGTVIDLTGVPITIGRANDATLVVTDDYASSRHARLYAQDGQWIVEDLGSTNGTYLGRTKVTRPMPVPPGVPVRIGKTVIELRK